MAASGEATEATKSKVKVANVQHYRRPLPATCIDFASAEGKEVFKEAINGPYMNCFFHLASQFRTQDEPAYCGLTTLVMVLNALSVDPGKVWKGPWRWYHENMLDCCVPLSDAMKKGINLFQFMCLATCNGLDVQMVQATESVQAEEFRRFVKTASQCDQQVLVCSYSRAGLLQSGDGHYSPVGGYHAGRDLVLIFDVARFKYPPHWVSLEMLWKAMQGIDEETGQPRGYFVLKRTTHTGISTVLFKLSKQFCVTTVTPTHHGIMNLTQQWWAWLRMECQIIYEKKDFFQLIVSKFIDIWCYLGHTDAEQLIDVKCCSELSEKHHVAIRDLLQALEKQLMFRVAEDTLQSAQSSQPDVDLKCVWCPCTKQALAVHGLKRSHFLAMVVLSWPYENLGSGALGKETYATLCTRYLREEMPQDDHLLKTEVEMLKRQFASIFCYYCSEKCS